MKSVICANGANGYSESQLGVLLSLHTSLKKLALKKKKKKTIFSLFLRRNFPAENWRAQAGTWPEKGGESRRQRSHCRPRGEGEGERKARWASKGEELAQISSAPVIGEEDGEGKAQKAWWNIRTWSCLSVLNWAIEF
jgi:hypothetical protein